VDDAALGRRDGAMTNIALSPTESASRSRRAGDFHDSRGESDTRNISHSAASAEIEPAWSPDGKYISYFSDKSGEYKVILEAPDALTPAREIALAKPRILYAVLVAGFEEANVHRHDLKIWVLDVASGQAKIVGNDPWMVPTRTINPVVEPRLEVGGLCQPAEVDVSRDLYFER